MISVFIEISICRKVMHCWKDFLSFPPAEEVTGKIHPQAYADPFPNPNPNPFPNLNLIPKPNNDFGKHPINASFEISK